MEGQLTSEELERRMAEVAEYWKGAFMVAAGKVWKKSKAGRRAGKVLTQTEILAGLGKHFPSVSSMSLADQGEFLSALIAMETEAEESGDAVLDQVDPWFVELMLAFRWRSDGTTMIGYFWKKYAEEIIAGRDPNRKEIVRELTLCSDIEGKGLATALAQHPVIWDEYQRIYMEACADPEVSVTPKTVKDGVRYYHTFRNYLAMQANAWASDTRFVLVEEPKTITNQPGTWAFWHFDPTRLPEEPKPTPAWDGWLAKLTTPSSAKVFKAWVFSVFDAGNRGRQLLWIEDNGAGGKGTISYVLQRFMGDIGCGAISASMLDSEFGAASAYGKRLLIHPDNKNPRILSSALIHQITGGDMILVRRLYETAFTARMNAKIIIMANCPPDSDLYNFHEKSRLAYLKLDPNNAGADRSHLVNTSTGVQLQGDPNFAQRLLDEMPDFLASAMDDYMELCPTRSNIIMPPDIVDQLESRCASVEQEKYEEFFADNFEAAEGKYLDSRTVRSTFDALYSGAKNNMSFSTFRKYLQTQGITFSRLGTGVRMRAFIGIKAKNTAGIDIPA